MSEEKVPIPEDLREFYERIEGIVPDSRTIRERRELKLYKRIASLEAANRELEARLAEMGKPVSDEEWEHRYDPDHDREYVLREDVDALLASRDKKGSK